jgi:hypothetical protein
LNFFCYFLQDLHFNKCGDCKPGQKTGQFLNALKQENIINTHTMKKAAIISGFVAAFAITLTCTFKFQHWPGANVVMILTGFFLSIYFPVYILDKMRDRSGGRTLPSHIAAAVSASLVNLGVVFKIQHWMGASILLVLGIAVFSLVFITLMFFQKLKDQPANAGMNAAGALGLATFALGLLFKIQHWPGAGVLIVIAPVLLFFIYFPMYIRNISISNSVKSNYLGNAFFVLVIGSMLALFALRIIAPAISNAT